MINSKELTTFTKSLNILFVEDHEELRNNTAEILSNFFNTVISVSNGQDALDLYHQKDLQDEPNYDIVITDIQMPILDGLSLIKEIYKVNPYQPIIVLSAHDESKYLLPLINLGIEQFIKKPIDYQELLKTLLKVSKKILQPDIQTSLDTLVKIQLGKTSVFDKQNSSLLDNNKNIYLTKYEIIFLQLLSENMGKIYISEDIVSTYITKNETIDSQNIRKLVSKLRKKLPTDSIESIYGSGYRLVPYTGS